jgi:hypothetical protein
VTIFDILVELNVAAIIVITRAVLPGIIPTAILSPLAIESISVASENVSLPLEPFFLRTTVEIAVAAVLTRHHRFEIVPAGKGVCASVSAAQVQCLELTNRAALKKFGGNGCYNNR